MVKAIQLTSQLWHYQADVPWCGLCLREKIASSKTRSQPAVISHCLEINSNFTWSLFVHNSQVDDENCSDLSSVPKCLDVISLFSLHCMLDIMSMFWTPWGALPHGCEKGQNSVCNFMWSACAGGMCSSKNYHSHLFSCLSAQMVSKFTNKQYLTTTQQ